MIDEPLGLAAVPDSDWPASRGPLSRYALADLEPIGPGARADAPLRLSSWHALISRAR